MEDESRVLHEITPLGAHDFLYIADRHKKEFTVPIFVPRMNFLGFFFDYWEIMFIFAAKRQIIHKTI